jgi:hypothetical protein
MIFTGRSISTTDLGADNTTRYLSPSGTSTPTTTESDVTMTMPRTCVVGDIYITLGTAPGGSEVRRFRIRTNATDSTLTCDVTGNNTSCMGNGGGTPTSLSAGDTVSVQSSVTSAGTPAATKLSFGWTCR